ncbi:hypothetical protein JCM19992_07710 [Thermostilla marina]
MFLPRHTVRHLLLVMVVAAVLGSVAYYAKTEQAAWALGILGAVSMVAVFFCLAAVTFAGAVAASALTQPLARRIRAKRSPFADSRTPPPSESVPNAAPQDTVVYDATIVPDSDSAGQPPAKTEDRS